MDAKNNEGPSDAEIDELALKALKQCWPNLEPSAMEYSAILDGLRSMCRHIGARKFELYYNLRLPSDRVEEWMRDCYQGRISEAGLRDRLKGDAERPLDLEMLTTFHEAFEANLLHYSAVLQKVVIRPSEDRNALRTRRRREISAHIKQLRAKLPLWKENLETVYDFLDDVRISANMGLAQLGPFEATSAHWLAHLLFKRIEEGWRSCVDIARRSRRDPRYMYAASAIDLFREQWLPTFPAPQNLGERLRHEFKFACRSLSAATAPASDPINADQHPTTAGATDNESLELVLFGDLTTIVASAGHIFRRLDTYDWGIDGEIEFRDSTRQPTGKKVYVQLKSGDSYLTRNASGQDIFRVRKRRHLQYWSQHAYPVLLVIRQSSGLIRWMNISAYAQRHGVENLSIVFEGSILDVQAIKKLAAASGGSESNPPQ